MKNLNLLLLAILLLSVAACTKKDSTKPVTPVTPVTPTSPYYFKGTFNGGTFSFADTVPQYMPLYAFEAGGFQDVSFTQYPDIGLALDWPNEDTVKESDLLGLIGKTLHFNDTAPNPSLVFDSAISGTQWTSVDTANTAFYVKITNVTYLKRDTTLGYYVKTYVITGTCNAIMTNYTQNVLLSNGSFSFIISRRDL